MAEICTEKVQRQECKGRLLWPVQRQSAERHAHTEYKDRQMQNAQGKVGTECKESHSQRDKADKEERCIYA